MAEVNKSTRATKDNLSTDRSKKANNYGMAKQPTWLKTVNATSKQESRRSPTADHTQTVTKKTQTRAQPYHRKRRY